MGTLIGKRFVSTKQELHVNLIKKLKGYRSNFWSSSARRENMLLIDKYYARSYGVTQEQLKARVSAIRGEAFRIQNFIAPIILPQVESALGYLDSVYLTGSPIIGVGAPPQYADAALAFSTILEDNSRNAGWARNLHKTFRDGLKYSIGAVEVDWESKRQVAVLNNGADVKLQEVFWKGNVIKSLDMYNVIYDRRINPVDVPERGDFAGYCEPITLPELRDYLNKLGESIHGNMAQAAINSRWSGASDESETAAYYVPNVNYDLTGSDKASRSSAGTDWQAFFNEGRKEVGGLTYSDAYLRTKLYLRIIPSVEGVSGVPEPSTPQIWKLVAINDVITEFRRVENAHGLLPILFVMPLEDNLGGQALSFAEHLVDMQDLSSAFWNATLESKRRAVNDRAIYNPLYLNASDVNNPNSAAKIPLRNSTYNKDLSNIYYPIPYRDEQSASFVQLADAMSRYSNVIVGNNPAKQGQFVKGNKTMREYEDVMGNSDIRNQMMALVIEYQFMWKIKEIIKYNTLQYQETTTYINIDEEAEVTIDPVKLRNSATFFKMTDGMTPADKLLSTEELTVAFQTMQAIPSIGADYRVSDVFAYMLKSRHVDLRPFKKSKAERDYEQQMMLWQQQAQMAAEKGAAFSTPMPTPPSQQQLAQEDQAQQQLSQLPLMQQVLQAAQQQGGNNANTAPPGTPASAGNAVQ